MSDLNFNETGNLQIKNRNRAHKPFKGNDALSETCTVLNFKLTTTQILSYVEIKFLPKTEHNFIKINPFSQTNTKGCLCTCKTGN